MTFVQMRFYFKIIIVNILVKHYVGIYFAHSACILNYCTKICHAIYTDNDLIMTYHLMKFLYFSMYINV